MKFSPNVYKYILKKYFKELRQAKVIIIKYIIME